MLSIMWNLQEQQRELFNKLIESKDSQIQQLKRNNRFIKKEIILFTKIRIQKCCLQAMMVLI